MGSLQQVKQSAGHVAYGSHLSFGPSEQPCEA
jgi:hypothetical protein